MSVFDQLATYLSYPLCRQRPCCGHTNDACCQPWHASTRFGARATLRFSVLVQRFGSWVLLRIIKHVHIDERSLRVQSKS